jgi:hypothetical protein
MSRRLLKLFALLLALVPLGAILYLSVRHYGKTDTTKMSDVEIRQKFDCGRITADVRETDVFCTPDFYRTPNITEAQYYEYLGCAERLKSPAPTDEQKQTDPSYVAAYQTCADKKVFTSELVKFRAQLVALKQKFNM